MRAQRHGAENARKKKTAEANCTPAIVRSPWSMKFTSMLDTRRRRRYDEDGQTDPRAGRVNRRYNSDDVLRCRCSLELVESSESQLQLS